MPLAQRSARSLPSRLPWGPAARLPRPPGAIWRWLDRQLTASSLRHPSLRPLATLPSASLATRNSARSRQRREPFRSQPPAGSWRGSRALPTSLPRMQFSRPMAARSEPSIPTARPRHSCGSPSAEPRGPPHLAGLPCGRMQGISTWPESMPTAMFRSPLQEARF